MKGFIKVTKSDNQTNYINVSNVIKFYRKSQDYTGILTVDGKETECKETFEELEKLFYNAFV